MLDEGSWNHHHNASNRSNNNTSSSINSSGNRFQHLGVSHMSMNPVYNQYDGRAAMSSGSGSNYVNGIHQRGAFPMHLLQNVRQVEHPLSIAEHQLTIAQDGENCEKRVIYNCMLGFRKFFVVHMSLIFVLKGLFLVPLRIFWGIRQIVCLWRLYLTPFMHKIYLDLKL